MAFLALTDESSSVVERFAKTTPLPYPVGTGQKSSDDYDIRGIPAAFLLDHKGNVIWKGNPGGRGWVDLLSPALAAAADALPTWNPGERSEVLRKATEAAIKGKFGKAYAECNKVLEKAGQDAHAFLADLEDVAERRLQLALNDAARGCYFEATEYLSAQAKAFAKTPWAESMTAKLKEWKKDKLAKKLFSLDRARLGAIEIVRGGDRKKGLKKLKSLLASAEETPLEEILQKDVETAGGF